VLIKAARPFVLP